MGIGVTFVMSAGVCKAIGQSASLDVSQGVGRDVRRSWDAIGQKVLLVGAVGTGVVRVGVVEERFVADMVVRAVGIF